MRDEQRKKNGGGGDAAPPRPARGPAKQDQVAEASEESFPASDPPAWTPSHPGTPDKHPGH